MSTIAQTDIETIARQILTTEDVDFRVFDAATHQTPVVLKRPLVVLKSAEMEGDVLVCRERRLRRAVGPSRWCLRCAEPWSTASPTASAPRTSRCWT